MLLLAQVTVSVQVTRATAPAHTSVLSDVLSRTLPRTGLLGGPTLILVALTLLCLGMALIKLGGSARATKGS